MFREMLSVMVLVLALCSIVATFIHDRNSPMTMFRYYKNKYNRVYKNKTEEERALNNFVNNLNKVTAMNDEDKNKVTVYTLNRYADIDTEDFEERYAIHLKPYDSEPKENIVADQQKELSRSKTEQELENIELYDLTKADKLYADYMKLYNKKNSTKKHERVAHYYRFIKTLVDINRNHFKGNRHVVLDENADVVMEPQEYFY